MRKTSVSSLRFKRSLSEATAKVCSQVTNLKVRVQDSDVEGLINLKNLTSVELLYNVGRPTTPALGTASFLQSRGQNLTSVALICSAISMVHIKLLGESCPYLRSLWLRSNHFQVTKGGRCEEVEGVKTETWTLPPPLEGLRLSGRHLVKRNPLQHDAPPV